MRRKKTSEPGDGSVRQRLLEGAAELFTRKGYAATTVREIVTLAGVTKPVLYYYFRNKEGIYLELLRGSFAKMDALLAQSGEDRETATQRLLRLCDRLYSLFLDNVKVARVMYAIYYGPHQGAPFFDFDAYHMKLRKAVQELIEEGVRRGEFRKEKPEEMAWAVIGAVNVAMEVHLTHPEWALGHEGLGRVLDLILEGIAVKKGRRK